MARVIDALAVALLTAAAVAFVLGLRSLTDHEDLRAIYLLVVGGLALKGSTDLLRGGAA